jgi:hypothetical protein
MIIDILGENLTMMMILCSTFDFFIVLQRPMFTQQHQLSEMLQRLGQVGLSPPFLPSSTDRKATLLDHDRH